MVLQQQSRIAGLPILTESFQSAESLLLAITNHEVIAEIAILDVHMRDIDGISLAKRINRILPNCKIIFLTSYISCAVDVYEADHVYLVLKDQQEERLWPAVELACKKLSDSAQDVIVFRTASGIEVRKLSDIQYFERIGRKTFVRCSTGDVWVSDSIGTIASSALPASFFRCHQGYIVNLDFVRSIEEDGFILQSSKQIPVSRSNKRDVVNRFYKNINAIILHRSTAK